jgi:glycosyltransferase involved in cell wall biosynthesis
MISLKYNNNLIAIVSGNNGTDVRIGKVCRSLSRLGFDLHLIGWDRRNGIKKKLELGATKIHMMNLTTPYGRATILGNLYFAFYAAHILKSLRPKTVCCIDEEYAIMLLPAKYVLYRHMVCDVFDGLNDRFSNRGKLYRLVLYIISQISRLGSDCLIATDNTRYERFGRYKSKSIVIENYPEDPGENLAKTQLEGPINIYASGSLSTKRGLRQLVQMLDSTNNVKVISAGWLYDDYSTNIFIKHPKVTFLGILTAKESLEKAALCDAVFSFYEPNSENNRYASPNKIYDAMSVGRPIIINEEVILSQWVVDNSLGFRLAYNDVDELKRIVQNLKMRRLSLISYAKHSRQLFQKGYRWEEVEKKLYSLYNKLSVD